MKTPPAYPVLDDRPIDQLKVTELKEELKRRKLTTKGLKDDLVRRLDEALRAEVESVEEVNVNNEIQATPEPLVPTDDLRAVADTPQPIVETENVGVLDVTPQPEANADGEGEKALVNEVLTSEVKIQDEEGTGTDLVETEEKLDDVTSVETSVTVTESVTHEVSMDVKESLEDDYVMVGHDLETQFESQKSGPPQDLEVKSSYASGQASEVSTDVAFQVTQLEADVAKPPQDDVKLNSADSSNQVSEVKIVLGFHIKSDSISSDSVSINEKNEIKDNIIDTNVKLELDVKPEMVHPSSSNIISDEPHPMDTEEPGDKKEPVEEFDERNANLDMTQKNDSIDVGLSEKLNLDRSSGDDSMDDDIMDNKPIDSKYNTEGVVDQGVKIEGSINEEAPVGMPNDIPADMKDVVDEMKKAPAAPIVKRKVNDQVVVGNNEITKRQRRWNTENLKVPEPESNTISSSTTPKDTFLTPTLNRNFSRSDSTASKETPKERVVPPSSKPPTTSLKIDQFVRPFTLKAVQELLGKTGSMVSFWMDHIKTHCYVTYSSVEEAIETRNAVYNLQWPPNGGRLLLAEFVDPLEVKTKVEGPPPSPATPAATKPSVQPQPPATSQPPRQQVQRQQALPPPPSLPPPPPLSNPPQARERLPPPPPVEKIEKMDTPIVTLDDLFKKTKATPRIYYLPLSDEQVAEKQRKMKQ